MNALVALSLRERKAQQLPHRSRLAEREGYINAIRQVLFITVALLPTTLPSPLLAQNKPTTQLTPAQAREEQAYSIGVQAYIYGYPLVEMYRIRYARVFDPDAKQRIPLNQLGHLRKLLDHTATTVVAPNNDTLYSGAWLDLAKEPLILHVPDTAGRYYVFQFMDFYTNNFASVGTRATGTKESHFVIVGPGWTGKLPAGLPRITSPTNAVWLLGRTLVDGQEDLPAVHALQDRYTLTPLHAWGKNEKPRVADANIRVPAYDLSDPLNFLRLLNVSLKENPPPPREAALMGLFGQIGVGPDKTFNIGGLDPATAQGLRRAVTMGQRIIAAAPVTERTAGPGWALPLATIGNFGDDYLYRAIIAKYTLAALSPEEAVYLSTSVDDQGKPLTGANRYVLRFEKGRFPPVDAFWSITMYRWPERFLVANAQGRYSIGDRTRGLRYGDDGSLEIHIQRERPAKAKESNGLPAPEGEFCLMLRCYLPRQQIANGTWKTPGVRRVE